MSTTSAPTVPTTRSIASATAVAGLLSIIANTVISQVAQAAGADPVAVPGLALPAYALFTVAGVLVGAVGWSVIRTRAARPSALLRWLVPAVVAISLVPTSWSASSWVCSVRPRSA
jgi:hypothetical protein